MCLTNSPSVSKKRVKFEKPYAFVTGKYDVRTIGNLGAELLATMMQIFCQYFATGLQSSPFKSSLFFVWFKERFSILHTVTFASQIYDLRSEKQTV